MSVASAASSPTAERRAVLVRRVRFIVAATITYNVIEAAIALTAGRMASSSALIAFGLDSIVEVLSAAAVAWQFAIPDHERREWLAMRLIGASFFGLAIIVTIDATRTLLGAQEAEHSSIGIALAAVSLAAMPLLSLLERRTGRELGSASAIADSAQTMLCTYLSAVLLLGLVLNSTLGWSWADPLAALVIAGVAVKEGVDAWRGKACCAPGAALTSEPAVDAGCQDCCGNAVEQERSLPNPAGQQVVLGMAPNTPHTSHVGEQVEGGETSARTGDR